MNPSPQRHSATYDADGNIILPQEEGLNSNPIPEEPAPEIAQIPEEPVEYSADPQAEEERFEERSHRLREFLGNIQARTAWGTSTILKESLRQYRFSVKPADLFRPVQNSARAVWAFLTQPVWIVHPKKTPKRYNRLTLFAFDTVRFGGTFVLLFAALFLSLNYQSFWQILSARIDPLENMEVQSPLASGVDSTIRDKLLRSPSLATAGLNEGDMLSFLPEVGPPENRLIIPKLNLNVPVVDPPFEALLQEDWAKVESDIQSALQAGVVHYPGTAKPGQAGNFFVTGHSSYYPWAEGNYKTVFARLGALSPGDEYWVYYNGDKHRYIVREKKEVKPSDVDVLDQPLNQRLSTLMTCTPVGTTLRRLIITSEEVDPETSKPLDVGEQPAREVPKFRMEMLPI